jgi:hypothetical protein
MKYSLAKLTLLLAATTTAAGCFCLPGKHNLPPAQQLMHPGPGVGGPGPGVLPGPSAMIPYGMPYTPRTSQLYFVGPEGTTVAWDASSEASFDSEPLVAPGRQNFPQGAIYRLKLTKIPGRQGVELYPTVEIAPENPRTEAFLAHNPIPIQFTEEDFDHVAASNFVTKVIYVPDPEFQELAVAGVGTLVSTRLDPGVDPIAEADRRGSILAIVRIGNIDLEVPAANGDAGEGSVKQAGYIARPGSVMPVAFHGATGAVPAGYEGAVMGGGPMMGGPVPMTQAPVSGVTMPQYGMAMSGTPIGLPGPPHVPLGIRAGLQSHTMVNHTRMNLPPPTSDMRIDVKQEPGYSYPKPASHGYIRERSFAPGLWFRNPFSNWLQQAP